MTFRSATFDSRESAFWWCASIFSAGTRITWQCLSLTARKCVRAKTWSPKKTNSNHRGLLLYLFDSSDEWNSVVLLHGVGGTKSVQFSLRTFTSPELLSITHAFCNYRLHRTVLPKTVYLLLSW